MVNIVLSILLSFLLQTPEEQAYFYFGNDNLIGVGNLVEGKKSGEWKVYSKANPVLSNDSNFNEADPDVFKKYFNQEMPAYVINFINDVPDGIFQENYPSGAIKTLGIFENGVLTKEFKEFYENGELEYAGRLERGKKEGEWHEYYENGQVKSSISYVEGLAEGEAVYYDSDGRIESKLSFSNGKKEGVYQSFFQDGELKEKGTFQDDVPTGEWVSFDPDKNIEFRGNLEEGVRNGEWIEELEVMIGYYRKGNYEKGLKEGRWLVSDTAGNQVQVENYKGGKLISVIALQQGAGLKNEYLVKKGNGQLIFYDDQGFIKAKGKVSKGEINGRWSFYFPGSDRLSSSGRIESSERIGTWNFYSFEGEIIDQIVYKPESKFVTGTNTAEALRTNHSILKNGNDALGTAYSKFSMFAPLRTVY